MKDGNVIGKVLDERNNRTNLENIDYLISNGHDPDNGHEEAHRTARHSRRWMVTFVGEHSNENGGGHATNSCSDQEGYFVLSST